MSPAVGRDARSRRLEAHQPGAGAPARTRQSPRVTTRAYSRNHFYSASTAGNAHPEREPYPSRTDPTTRRPSRLAVGARLEGAGVLFNDADRLPGGGADRDAVRVYIDARLADCAPLSQTCSLAAVKAGRECAPSC